jgi:hypothetical protein
VVRGVRLVVVVVVVLLATRAVMLLLLLLFLAEGVLGMVVEEGRRLPVRRREGEARQSERGHHHDRRPARIPSSVQPRRSSQDACLGRVMFEEGGGDEVGGSERRTAIPQKPHQQRTSSSVASTQGLPQSMPRGRVCGMGCEEV